MRIPPADFEALDLEVHGFLSDVPLHDVSRIRLPGGGPGRTVADVRRLMRAGDAPGSPIVRALFGLRKLAGKLLGWDRDAHARPTEAYLRRVPDELRARSEVEPGTPDGPFRIVYVLPREMVAEVRNATVHAFSCIVLVPDGESDTDGGYLLYWAIYVKPVSRLTRPYMAAIEPFRRLIVYPSILRHLRKAWSAAAVLRVEGD